MSHSSPLSNDEIAPSLHDHAGFVHLRTRSSYSLLDGMLSPQALVSWAQNEKMPAIALADDQNLFGVVEFALAANRAGVQPLIAASLQLKSENSVQWGDARAQSVVLIAQNATGYANLNRLVTALYLPLNPSKQADHYEQMNLNFTDLATYAEGLILLTGGLGAPVGEAIISNQPSEAARWLDQAKEAFDDRLFCEIQRHGLPSEEEALHGIIQMADQRQIPLVATNDCRFRVHNEFIYHDALRAIARSEKVNQESGRQRLNESYYFRNVVEMKQLFSDLPDALANSLHIAQTCHFTLQDQSMQPKLPKVKSLPDQVNADQFLKQKTIEGLNQRLQGLGISAQTDQEKPYLERMEHELKIIEKSGFAGYFLIVADFIAWAKDNNIPVGPGRGSGVGSLVAWALQITALDPLEWNLLFERFLNLERISVPDFDIDFCTEKRDLVIDYVRHAYGEDSVAQIITFGSLRSRAAIRDICRVLGLPYGVGDRICKMLPKEDPGNPQKLDELVEQEPALKSMIHNDPEVTDLWKYATVLEGTYRHASTHAAGVVISDRSLLGEVALYYDPKNNLKATQLNMKSAEKAGLVKFDFLGLSTMTTITHCIDDVARIYEKEVDFDTLHLDDPDVFNLISQGFTDGIFQLESPGMRRVAVQLKPDCFADIIAMVALFRPGPMENIPRFIRCKHGDEEISYPHILLKEILKETYGIAIYQEQIMQMTQTLAGFSLGKADQVRRAMGKKDQKMLADMRSEFVEAAQKIHKIPKGDGEPIFDTIQAFAAYGFNKSHSAAYALVAYWTGWLKAHFPDCFLTALLNNSLQIPNNIAQYILDARRLDINILPPDINFSVPHFFLHKPNHIRYGLGAIRGVGVSIMEAVIAERKAYGLFKDIGDFTLRTRDLGVNKRILDALICSGAMDSIIPNRNSAYQKVLPLVDYARHCREVPQGDSMLFTPEFPNPPALAKETEWEGGLFLEHEFRTLGFHFKKHPLDLYTQHMKDFGVTAYKDLTHIIDQKGAVRIAGYVYDGILTKTRPRPARGKRPAEDAQPLYILKISDANHRFSVNIEGQELIDETLELIKQSPLLLIDGYARWSHIQWNINGYKIQGLTSATPQGDESLTLRLEKKDKLLDIRDILANTEASKGAQVTLIIPSEQGDVTYKLPSFYRISMEMRRKLAQLPHVTLWAKLRDFDSEMMFDEDQL